jgi:hypothetical protein
MIFESSAGSAHAAANTRFNICVHSASAAAAGIFEQRADGL